MRGGYFSLSKVYVETTPIAPFLSTSSIGSIVETIISNKKTNSQYNTRDLEKQIDQLVYRLFGLTEEEIRIVEDR